MKKIVIYLFIVACIHNLHAQDPFPTQEKYKLKNGMQVIFMDYGDIAVTTIGIYINTGRKNETPGMQSIASLTANALGLGNAKYGRTKQDSILFTTGASLSAGSNDNYTEVAMQFLDKDQGLAMDLLSGYLLQPTFPKDELDYYIEEELQRSSPAKMNITSMAAIYSRFYVFGASNPLGRSFYASQLKKIGAEQVKEFYKFNYTPKNTTMVISGKPDRDKLKILIEQYFGPWHAAYGEVNGVSLPSPEFDKKEYAFVNRENATQAALTWVKKGPQADSKNLAAFEMANYAFNILLMDQIRQKEGKTYGIGSRFSEENNNGIFSISAQVRNEVMFATLESFDKTLQKFHDSGVSGENLQIAEVSVYRNYLAVESPSQLIALFNPILYPDYDKRKQYLLNLGKTDKATIDKAVKKYFTPGSYKLIIAGSETELKEQLVKIKGLVRLPLNAIEVDN